MDILPSVLSVVSIWSYPAPLDIRCRDYRFLRFSSQTFGSISASISSFLVSSVWLFFLSNCFLLSSFFGQSFPLLLSLVFPLDFPVGYFHFFLNLLSAHLFNCIGLSHGFGCIVSSFFRSHASLCRLFKMTSIRPWCLFLPSVCFRCSGWLIPGHSPP